MKQLTARQTSQRIKIIHRKMGKLREQGNKLHQQKTRDLAKLLEKVEKDFDRQWAKSQNGKSEQGINQKTKDFLQELSLLEATCPNRANHDSSPGRYYHCAICNYVWDDTSQAHP